MQYKFILILLFSLLISFNAYSGINDKCVEPDKGFRNNAPGRGWFWGEQVCEPVLDNETQNTANKEFDNAIDNKSEWKILPKTANIPWDILDTLDPDEIANKIEPEAKKVAVMYPTEENILNYRKLSNWIFAKAKYYTTADTQVRVENPNIVEAAITGPTSKVRRTINYLYREESEQAILKPYADRAKLIVYTRDNCKYCIAQRPLLQRFNQVFGWEIMERRLEDNPEEMVILNIEYTPDIFIILNTPQGVKYQRIATGLTQYADLVKAAINGLRYSGENIPDIENKPNILEVGKNE